MTRGARRGRVGPALAVAMLALGGCVSVPTSGPVEQVQPRSSSEELLPVVTPSGPADGAAPAAIVDGWLTAMEAFPVSTEVARQFLTADAAARWSPRLRAVVYETATVTASSAEVAGHSAVEVRTRARARLTSHGTYLPGPAPGGDELTRLRLVRTGAGWRIADPPDAALISAGFFDEYFQPFDLYFLDPTGQRLVADPVWLPQGDQLATRLAQGLLAGPTPWLRHQATTTVTAEASADVAVPVRADGTAEVQLEEAVADLSGEQLQTLSAQLVWTLRQVPGVTGLQLVAGGPLDVPGASPVQPIESWGQYDPSGPSARSQVYAVRGGAIVGVAQDAVSAVAGWWGSGDAEVGEISVRSDLVRIAATDPQRRRLLVGGLAAEDRAAISTWYASDGGTLVDPQWDLGGLLWVADRRPGRDRVVVASGAGTDTVRSGSIGRAGVRALAVAPDGARVAVLVDRWRGRVWGGAGGRVTGPQLVLARVDRTRDGRGVRRLSGAYAVPVAAQGLRGLDAVVWAAPSLVGVLARVGGTPQQPYRVPLDGSPIAGGALTSEPLLPAIGATELSAAGVSGAQTVVGDERGRLWAVDSRGEWSLVVDHVRNARHPD